MITKKCNRDHTQQTTPQLTVILGDIRDVCIYILRILIGRCSRLMMKFFAMRLFTPVTNHMIFIWFLNYDHSQAWYLYWIWNVYAVVVGIKNRCRLKNQLMWLLLILVGSEFKLTIWLLESKYQMMKNWKLDKIATEMMTNHCLA